MWPHRRLRYQLGQRPNGDVAAYAATSPAGVRDRGATLAVGGFDNRNTDKAAPWTQNADLSYDFLPALKRWLRDLLVGQGFEILDQLLQRRQARQFGDRRDLEALRHGEELRVA